MKSLLSLTLLCAAALVLPACGEDDPTPTPVSDTLDLTLDLALKGYNTNATGVGSFGVATTEQAARASKSTEGSGSLAWVDTNGGKSTRQFTLYQRKKGEKLWVFVNANRKAQAGQTVTLTWPVGHSLTVSAATDSVVVTSFVVGQ